MSSLGISKSLQRLEFLPYMCYVCWPTQMLHFVCKSNNWNGSRMGLGSMSACGVSLLKDSHCLPDIASAILLSLPDTCLALNCILFCNALSTSGLRNDITLSDLDDCLFNMWTNETLSKNSMIFSHSASFPICRRLKQLALVPGKWYPENWVFIQASGPCK